MKLACIASLAALSGNQAWSQEFIWTDGTGTNLWNTFANWNPAGVPNAAGESAVLNSGPVILNTSVSIDALTVGAGVDLSVDSGGSTRNLNFTGAVPGALSNQGSITTKNNTDFEFRGMAVNQGTIVLEGGTGPAAAADIEVAADTLLSGGGTITLMGRPFARINGGSGPTVTLTISNQRIQGSGFIGSDSLNVVLEAGNVVDANDAGETLRIDRAFINRGILQASQGGILTFHEAIVDNASGIIRALEASTVDLARIGVDAAHISGGILSSSGSGVVENGGGSTSTRVTLEDVTIQGRFVMGNNSTTNIEGNLTNEGTITLNSGDMFASGAYLRFLEGTPTITGGGTVFLNGPFARIINEGNVRVTFLDQTIEGSGSIASDVKPIFGPGSSILANVPGETLEVQVDPETPVSANGTFTVSPGSTLSISDAGQSGQFTNGGQIKLSSTLGQQAVSKLLIGGNTILNGGGKIVMEGPSSQIEGDADAQPVVADQTIEGSGQIAPSFAPTWGVKSTVHANQPGETLGIQFNYTKPLVSLGTFTVNPGSTLNLFPTPGAATPPQITHSGQLNANGTVSAPGSHFSYTKGSQITGFGLVQSKGFFNNGFLSPGASPGTLTLTMETASDLVELGPDAVLALEIGGTTAGTEHDVLDVQGGLTVGGALQVSLLSFQPDPADLFTVVTQSEGFGALSGTFDGIANGETVSTADGGGTFAVNYQTAAVTLSDFSLTPFGVWKEANLGTDAFDPLIGHPVLGDPNQNSTSILLEYAFLMDPLAGNDEDKLPTAATAMDGGVSYPAIAFRRLTGAADGLIYSVWESTDLVGWTQLDLTTHLVETVDHGDGSETITVRGTTPQSGAESTERTFLQVRVTLQA